MSNVFQNISYGAAELKNFYQGPMIDILNENLKVLKLCEKVTDGWNGLQVVRPIRVSRNQGIGATTDGGNLPNIGRQTTVQAQISAKYNYLRAGVSGPMMAASSSDVGSFVRSAAYEMKMGFMDLKNDINRQLGWDGSGTLATSNAAVAGSNTIVIAGRTSTEEALKFVDVGLEFDIYTSGGTVVQTGVTVLSITSPDPNALTATLVCDQVINCSATDVLVRTGAFNNEIQGLFYALDGGTSTIYNVNRSTYFSFQGNVVDDSSAQLKLDDMQKAWNQGLRRGNVQNYSAILCDFASIRMYQKLLVPDKRYVNTTSADGVLGDKDGTFNMEFSGIPIEPDKDFPTRFAFLPQSVLKNYVLKELAWADETGAPYIAQTGTDQFEMRLRYFTNLFNEQPASCAVLKNYISP
jgi:hypothetical protein